MSRRIGTLAAFVSAALAGCATQQPQGTLAELAAVQPDVEEIYLEDGLERAADSYRRYLEETSESARTPEAMRRLADLQIEQAYGVIGSGEVVEVAAATAEPRQVQAPAMIKPEAADMAAPESATPVKRMDTAAAVAAPAGPTESERDFEQRASQRQDLLGDISADNDLLTGAGGEPIPTGPREAIETYRKILETYPNYERNTYPLIAYVQSQDTRKTTSYCFRFL